jgi:hypothetical protein
VIESPRLPTGHQRQNAFRLEQPLPGGVICPRIFVIGS